MANQQKNSEIKFENSRRNLCIICDKKMKSVNVVVCRKCGHASKYSFKVVTENLIDIKSKCCNWDVNVHQKMTCSDFCHNEFVRLLIIQKGKYQKVIDGETTLAHKIPTRILIEKGIQQKDVFKFPLWVD